jgi:tetratricopeptide (TPR) repeat protein
MMSTIDTFAAMGYGYEWVRAIGHQGLCLIGLGQYERGLADLNQAHARALEIDKPIILSMTHMYYAVGSMHSGDWPFMLSSGQKCLEAARQCGEKIYQAFGLGFLAWAENQLGRPDAALKHFKDTQEIAREMGGPLLFSLLFDAVHAEILLNAGWLAEAMEYAQQVVARATAAHNYTAWGLGERVWGMALHRSDPTAATEVDGHLAASVAALSTGWLALDVARTRLGWASIYRDRRDLDQARKLLDEATLQFTLSACPYALDCAKQLALTWQLPTRQYGSLRR